MLRVLARCGVLLAGTLSASLPLAETDAIAALQPAEDEFHFVVLGDSQFHDPTTFNRMIDDVRLLQPAFVIQVGDMVEGYVAGLDEMESQWVRFRRQIAPLAPTVFLPVPGNHDLYDTERHATAEFEQIYKRIWGDLYYNFRYRNAEFFVLNTDGVHSESRIDTAQLTWLTEGLARSRAEHLFVFMHRPPSSLEQAEELHALLRRYPVRNVFYGHHHHYHFVERDGIGYVMTNAAADGAFSQDETGSFDHFLMVSVRDSTTRFAVVRADALEAPGIVHPSDNYDLFEISRALAPKNVDLTASVSGWKMLIPLENPSDRELTLYLSCRSEDERWQFSPRRIPPVTLQPGEHRSLTLEVGFAHNRRPESQPYCEIRLPFATWNGGWFDHRQRVTGNYSER
ncbi:MAG: metallophosphoesterase [Pseudomonadales bacterium]